MKEESIVLRITCLDDDCGMFSVYRYFKDGSFSRVLESCCHPKKSLSYTEVKEEFAKRQTG